MEKNDPFNIPFVRANEENGVVIQTWGDGIPLVVIPGLEGNGHSCLHVIVPAIEELKEQGIAIRLCLVNYSGEVHATLDTLTETIERLLQKTLADQELLVFSQSFGNLLMASIARRKKLSFKKLFLVSPFSSLPKLSIRLANLSMYVTPTWLYRRTIKPMGRYVFGPIGETSKDHPFFQALTQATSKQVRRETSWLVNINYEPVYREIDVPMTIILGQKDRLVNIKKEIAYFESLCSERSNCKLVLNENNGHVILIHNEVIWAKNALVKFLESN